MKCLLVLILIAVSTYHTYASFPNNDLLIDSREKSLDTMTEASFNETLKSFEDRWQNYVKEKKNKKLIVQGKWDSSRVNAHATRDDDNNPMIVIHGGIARYELMNEDSLKLILCHELGHHFGGAPKSLRGKSSRRSWSSAEGQADYFATSFCMGKTLVERDWDLYEKPLNDELVLGLVECNTFKCKRILKASLIVSKMFASLKFSWKEPSFESRASREVLKTNYKHPEPQCRLDTYVAGFKCGRHRELEFDDQDPFYVSCAQEWSRPLCWFSPNKY